MTPVIAGGRPRDLFFWQGLSVDLWYGSRFLFHFFGDGYLLGLGELTLLVVDLDGIDEFGDTIEQRTPAKDKHCYCRRIHRTDDDIETCEQDDTREYPVAEAHFSEMTGIEQVHELVDGT